MKPRAAWPLLAKKAKEKCDLIQVEVVKARERIKQLEASKQRMVLLYDDYLQRSKEAERKTHSMAETLNFRSFMLQLQQLIQRVDLDLTDANNQLAMIKRRLLAAEKKRIQMETLHEQDLKKVNDYQRKKRAKPDGCCRRHALQHAGVKHLATHPARLQPVPIVLAKRPGHQLGGRVGGQHHLCEVIAPGGVGANRLQQALCERSVDALRRNVCLHQPRQLRRRFVYIDRP